jgi:hypothetical protein
MERIHPVTEAQSFCHLCCAPRDGTPDLAFESHHAGMTVCLHVKHWNPQPGGAAVAARLGSGCAGAKPGGGCCLPAPLPPAARALRPASAPARFSSIRCSPSCASSTSDWLACRSSSTMASCALGLVAAARSLPSASPLLCDCVCDGMAHDGYIVQCGGTASGTAPSSSGSQSQ